MTSQFPSLTGSGIPGRAAQFALALSREGAVHLFSALSEQDLESEAKRGGATIEPYARAITSVMESRRQPERRGPAAVQRFPERLSRALARADDAKPFDVVVVIHSLSGCVLGPLTKAVVVVDEPELRSSRENRALVDLGTRTLSRWLGARQGEGHERRVWRRADAISVANDRDLLQVQQVRSDLGVVVPNGIDTHTGCYTPPSLRSGNRILFVGDLCASPIVRGVKELVGEVLPRVRVQVPDASLTLAGQKVCREVRALESAHVRVRGMDEDFSRLMREHATYAIPMTSGPDGWKGVLEPMACGLPIVAPPTLLREYGMQQGVGYAVCSSIAQMADSLIAVLKGRSGFDPMALSARRTAERYDWQIVGDQFVQLVMAAISRKKRLGRQK
ncbi:MAG TPA: glycosyltransferase [Polyangiaceae bacterium]|nr:glycosyltransferase [Polyangiaceae bacterium]